MEYTQPHARYVIYLPLPRALEVHLEDAFLQPIGLTRPAMGYHLSLLGPFVARAEPWDGADGRLAGVCARHLPLTLNLEPPALFRAPDANTLILPVALSTELAALQGALYAALSAEIVLDRDQSAAAYRPHVTLGIGLLDADVERLPELRLPPAAERLEVNEVRLARQHVHGPWMVLHHYALGDGGDAQADE